MVGKVGFARKKGETIAILGLAFPGFGKITGKRRVLIGLEGDCIRLHEWAGRSGVRGRKTKFGYHLHRPNLGLTGVTE